MPGCAAANCRTITPPMLCPTAMTLLSPTCSNDVRNIVGIGRDRVWSRRLVALAVPAEVYGNDAMPPGEVFCLRSKERAIAGRPVHKDKGGLPGATIFENQLDAVTNNCRHHHFPLFCAEPWSDGIAAPPASELVKVCAALIWRLLPNSRPRRRRRVRSSCRAGRGGSSGIPANCTSA